MKIRWTSSISYLGTSQSHLFHSEAGIHALDIDFTLLDTYGNQEGKGFNYHYQAHGYHPLLCYNGLTGDLLKAQLRGGLSFAARMRICL